VNHTTITMGSIVIDELIVPISGIQLIDGLIRLEAQLYGPLRAVDVDNFTVHDRDGGLVVRVMGCPIRWKQLGPFDALTVIAPLGLKDKAATGNGQYVL
jgi:hypothetical protein